MDEMSDGYKNTLSMIGDIAYRMAVMNPMLGNRVLEETPGIVLIDEVDLHLHPQWQQSILKDLHAIFPKVQFIVTSHAPAVINSVSREKIRMLDKGEIYMPAAETYGRDANSILREVISGTMIKVDELANALQVCVDSGAKKALLPMTSAADLGTVPADLIGSFNLIFYSSAEDAVFKALGVE